MNLGTYTPTKVMKIALADGKQYEVAHMFGDSRALVNYDGLYVFVDLVGGIWDLSGEPARDDEKPILAALTAPMNDQSILTVTKDE